MHTNFDLPFDPIKDIDPEELIGVIRGLTENASITIVTTAEGFTEVLDGVDPENIRYIRETDAICIGGLGCPYTLTVKAPDTITAADVTPQSPTYQGMDWQFNIE